MALRKADKSKIRKFEDGDGAWIVLRTQLTKGEQLRLQDLSNNIEVPVGDEGRARTGVRMESATFLTQRAVFSMLCVEWSLTADKPPNVADYEALDEESGDWVDACIDEILGERRARQNPETESGKNERSASTTPRSSPSPSPSEATSE